MVVITSSTHHRQVTDWLWEIDQATASQDLNDAGSVCGCIRIQFETLGSQVAKGVMKIMIPRDESVWAAYVGMPRRCVNVVSPCAEVKTQGLNPRPGLVTQANNQNCVTQFQLATIGQVVLSSVLSEGNQGPVELQTGPAEAQRFP